MSWTWDGQITQSTGSDAEPILANAIDIPYSGRRPDLPGVATYVTPPGAPVDPDRDSSRTRRALRHRMANGAKVDSSVDVDESFEGGGLIMPTAWSSDGNGGYFSQSFIVRTRGRSGPATKGSPASFGPTYPSDEELFLEGCGETGSGDDAQNTGHVADFSAYMEYQPRNATLAMVRNPLPREETTEGTRGYNRSMVHSTVSGSGSGMTVRPRAARSGSSVVADGWSKAQSQSDARNLRLADDDLLLLSSFPESAHDHFEQEQDPQGQPMIRQWGASAYQPVETDAFMQWNPHIGGDSPSGEGHTLLHNWGERRGINNMTTGSLDDSSLW